MMWVESLFCDSFLINYGGHFWYDFMIPLSIFVYFLNYFLNHLLVHLRIEAKDLLYFIIRKCATVVFIKHFECL